MFNYTTTTFSFNENQMWFILNPVTDPEGDDLTVTIFSGNTDNVLTLENTAGPSSGTPVPDAWEIYPINSNGIDFESYPSFALVIKAEDAFGNITLSDPITITINNLNDNSPVTENKTIAINQNLPNGQSVTSVLGSDVDGDALTFSIDSGNTDNAFSIHETTGEIVVANTTALVFSANPTFTLNVGVSDPDFTTTATITINLNEQAVNTAPSISNQTFRLAENSENGTIVGTIVAGDLEGDVLTFAIVSGNTSNAFLLSSSTGQFIVTNSAVLDFETKPSFSILVSVSDGSLTETATITIDLEDVDEEPILGVSDLEKTLSIYPNPTADYFQLSKNREGLKIVVLDASAKIIRRFDFNADNQYSLRGIDAGMYIIQINSADNTSQGRIIIK